MHNANSVQRLINTTRRKQGDDGDYSNYNIVSMYFTKDRDRITNDEQLMNDQWTNDAQIAFQSLLTSEIQHQNAKAKRSRLEFRFRVHTTTFDKFESTNLRTLKVALEYMYNSANRGPSESSESTINPPSGDKRQQMPTTHFSCVRRLRQNSHKHRNSFCCQYCGALGLVEGDQMALGTPAQRDLEASGYTFLIDENIPVYTASLLGASRERVGLNVSAMICELSA